ncbi:MAG TPA: hypothetical protein VFD43_01585 [Planctomycetota bacterium]|nr:hypothetical protein [Planctomycetota bacterium]
MRCLVAAAAALLAAASVEPASAQSTLADQTSVVVTGKGLFLVPPGQPAFQVCDSAPFGGGTLEAPSVTWINGTNAFLVTRRDLSGLGGLWRVQLQPDGTGAVQDLTPAIPAALGRDFADADYSVGLDTLFLLERATGRVLVHLHPAVGGDSGFFPWASLPADVGVSLAVRGAKHPFSVLVVTATGEVMQVDKHGTSFLNQANNPSWSGVATDPLGGGYYLCSDTADKVVLGKPDFPSGIPQAYISFNTYDFAGPCGPLAGYPLDIALDPRTNRVVALAGAAVPSCAFGGVATGKNHVIRLPLVAFGPPGSEPVLLSNAGDSGVVGSHGDLAFVRHGTADITWYGLPGSGAGTSTPVFGDAGVASALLVGQAAQQELGGAPPLAPAALVLGLVPLNASLQGQLFGPFPHGLLPATTDAAGAAQVPVALPAVTALTGLRVYMQWWIDDTTTPASGDLASSQVGIFTIGTP